MHVDDDGNDHPRVLVHLAPFLTEILGFTKSTFLSAGVYTLERVVDIDPITVIYI